MHHKLFILFFLILSLFIFSSKKVFALSYSSANCGQTIALVDGTYSELIVNAACSSANPLTIRAVNDGKVFFNGQNTNRPCNISNSSWVNVEGIVCHHSENMVFGIQNSSNIKLSRVSAYQAGPDYADHVFEIYRSNHITLEDTAATGRGRNMYLAYESSFVTFRRCWGRYSENGNNNTGADFMQIYGSSDSLIENCVGTRRPSGILVDINQYWYATWNGSYRVDRNRTFGSVFYGHDYHGLNVISANGQLHGNSVENSVFVGNNTTQGFGTPYTGIFQRVDDGFIMNRLTLVNHQMAVSQSHDSSNPSFTINGSLKNTSILNSSIGINRAQESSISLDHQYNNFFNVATRYSGTTQGTGETSINPNYDTAKYGKGAYLFPPSALKGKGENGADIGAEVLYQTVNGVSNGKTLWPFPMEDRIQSETQSILGEKISVTWESMGGLWKTLDGVYGATAYSTPTPTSSLGNTPTPTISASATTPTPITTGSIPTPTSSLIHTPTTMINFALLPTGQPSCDPCGWCQDDPENKPPNWDACMTCLSTPKHYYTVLGCLSTVPGVFVQSMMRIVFGICGGIAFLSVLYGSVLILTSSGDPKKLKNGKDTILYSLIGLFLVIFSVFLLRVVGYDILRIPGFR